MRILALETATLAGGAALLDGDAVIAETRSNIALTHSERVMAAVDRVLRDARWTVNDLDGLAVSIGPGSFTGLRVGLATVKGLAFARSLPVAPVPTLDALAATLPFADAPVVPLLGARKNEVYLSCYRWDGGAMARQWDYLALPPEAAVARLLLPVIVLGDGVAACRPYLAARGRRARRPAGPAAAVARRRGPARPRDPHRRRRDLGRRGVRALSRPVRGRAQAATGGRGRGRPCVIPGRPRRRSVP
jgi:tRNA threonylcarbamoyladenosine biosynthesis protein TsaB